MDSVPILFPPSLSSLSTLVSLLASDIYKPHEGGGWRVEGVGG